ncbi:MAG: hypothetical protein RI897_529 [Verrucomicrobiota bacterium]|jgi:hypothetical protein
MRGFGRAARAGCAEGAGGLGPLTAGPACRSVEDGSAEHRVRFGLFIQIEAGVPEK